VSRLRRSGILIRLPTALPWANLRAHLRRLGASSRAQCHYLWNRIESHALQERERAQTA